MRHVPLAIVAVLFACTGDSIVDNRSQALPENRGVEVSLGAHEAAPYSPLEWSADGTEIYFQTNQQPGRLMAVSLTGQVRELDGPRDAYVDLSVAADGKSLYFAADLQGGHRSTYRLPLPSGQAEQLAAQSSAVLAGRPADGLLALAAPTGANVAFTSLPDSINLLNAETGQRRLVARGCERIVAFSPDVQRLLCQTGGGGAGSYSIVELASGLIQPTLIIPVLDTRALFVHWNANGIRVVYETPLGLALWDVTLQQVTVNWSIPLRSGIVLDRQNGDWSNDGNRIAIWLHECLRTQGLSRCLNGQSLLYTLNPANGQSALVAVAHGTEGGNTIAFSPNGTRVAYVFEGKIYHQSTTPQ